MPKVTTAERRAAYLADADVQIATRLGVQLSSASSNRIVLHALSRYRATSNPGQAIEAVRGLMPRAVYGSILPAMLYAWMLAFTRAPKQAAPAEEIAFDKGPRPTPKRKNTKTGGADTLSGAVEFLRKRLDIPVATLRRREKDMRAQAFTVAKDVSAAVEKRLQRVIVDMTRKGVHVKEGVARLEDAFARAGVTAVKPHAIEAIFRTQTAFAYAAGEEEIDASPEIDEILWGYTYVTVGDDRVRPAHEAMDGTTLPKDDPFWEKNTPPNGFNCRCRRIRVFEPERKVRPPKTIKVDGKPVNVGADPGFEWSPLDLLG